MGALNQPNPLLAFKGVYAITHSSAAFNVECQNPAVVLEVHYAAIVNQARASRALFRVFLVLGTAGLVDLLWHLSAIRPTGAGWWIWVGIVVALQCCLGAVVGRLSTRFRGWTWTARERAAYFGFLFVVMTCNTSAEEALGNTSGPWLWSLLVISLSLGFFLSRATPHRNGPASDPGSELPA